MREIECIHPYFVDVVSTDTRRHHQSCICPGRATASRCIRNYDAILQAQSRSKILGSYRTKSKRTNSTTKTTENSTNCKHETHCSSAERRWIPSRAHRGEGCGFEDVIDTTILYVQRTTNVCSIRAAETKANSRSLFG